MLKRASKWNICKFQTLIAPDAQGFDSGGRKEDSPGFVRTLKARCRRDEKQIDLAEQLESVAYVLCGDEKVSLDKFCQILQAKGIVDKLFRIIDQDSDGVITAAQIMEFLANITNTRKRSGFDKGNLEWLEQLFRQTVGNEKEIRRDDFKKILITKNPFFTERVFQIFDKDDSGSISLQEFLDAMHQFAGQSPDDKIKFLFKVYDLDGDGLIQHRELQHVMRACMEENGMQFSEEQIDDLTMALFEDADSESRGAITYESLKNQLEKHGGLLENLSIRAIISINVVNDQTINTGNYTLAEWILTNRPGLFGLVPGVANPTGVALIIILIIMFICSQAFVRRGGSFEIFYWTHLLYLPFWILLLLHGPNFWKWFIIPGIIYIIERIMRFSWMKSERGKTYISSGILLPSRVTHLVIKRPLHFDFHSGDYVFINIPAIAKYEWHPFTISSAPEQEGYMWLHIRGVGEWTNRLYNYFEKEQEKLHSIREDLPQTNTIQKASNGAALNENKTIKRIQDSLRKKFANKDPSSSHSDSFNRIQDGYTNDGFISNENIHSSTESDISLKPISASNDAVNLSNRKLNPTKKMHFMLLHKKPLSKSLSMPDMDNRTKKRQRLLVLREYARSESEKSFDECQIRRARLQSLGLAYLSPQNKSLAQSFRYMRNKPTIIAFKTPSLENCEAKMSALSVLNKQDLELFGSVERAMEEGRVNREEENKMDGNKPHSPVNYPVGKPLEIYLDGPYGAPSSHIFRAQHAVLIATGIGVTPFASILQSIMHRYWKARHCCPNCKHTWVSEIPPTVMHLRKVDFFWINRDQRSFEWFVNLLSQLEIEQAELGGAMERFLEMHMYITSALQKTDMKAVGLQLALDLLHEKEKRDLITGLKTRTNAGRPNWDKVFKQLLDQKKGKVTVFYCGPPQLARILRLKCDQFGFSFRKEVF
ncbi:NADPH oxidase 5 [Halyomorpha halys]|uniref:NADPH oxidase 5 n=1 Tax=Halyomorpha halys TaxID=286706 RepID=UPI0006D4FDD6